MSQKKIIFIIAIILIAITAIAFLILKRYSTIFAESNNQWVLKSNNQIVHQYNGREYTYNILTTSDVGTNVDIFDVRQIQLATNEQYGTGVPKEFKCQNCIRFQLSPNDYQRQNFPFLTIITDSTKKQILMAGLFIQDKIIQGGNNNYAIAIATGKTNFSGNLHDYFISNLDTPDTTKLNTLKQSQWWYQYYRYINSLKDINIINQSGDSNTLPNLPTEVHQSCKERLMAPPYIKSNNNGIPPEIASAVDLIKNQWKINNFDPVKLIGTGNGGVFHEETFNNYILSLQQQFQLQNPTEPTESYETLNGILLSTEQDLANKIDAMWTASETSENVNNNITHWGCGIAAMLPAYVGAAIGFSGGSIPGFVGGMAAGQAAGTAGCVALAQYVNNNIRSDQVQAFLKSLAESLYVSDYMIHYLNYLDCIVKDPRTPQELKDAINKELATFQDKLNGIQKLQESGLTTATQPADSFWDQIFGGFTNLMKQWMTALLNWLWKGLFSGSPL